MWESWDTKRGKSMFGQCAGGVPLLVSKRGPTYRGTDEHSIGAARRRYHMRCFLLRLGSCYLLRLASCIYRVTRRLMISGSVWGPERTLQLMQGLLTWRPNPLSNFLLEWRNICIACIDLHAQRAYMHPRLRWAASLTEAILGLASIRNYLGCCSCKQKAKLRTLV